LGREARPKQVIVYADKNGKEPFTDWLDGLQDTVVRRRILTRLSRLAQGNYGDCKLLGEGIHELRLFFGAGYRVYFGEREANIVVLLCGGEKDTQGQDIKTAKALWKEYLNDAQLQNIQ
jgi:putative addiction module killer protein